MLTAAVSRVGSTASWDASCASTCAMSGSCVVTRMGRASVSCSACASRSAAINCGAREKRGRVLIRGDGKGLSRA
jgi:hypothetical protein